MSEDDVLHPKHYADEIEPIDFYQANSTPDEFRGFLKCNAMKYLARLGKKGSALEDAQKAGVYVGWLVAQEMGIFDRTELRPSGIVDLLGIRERILEGLGLHDLSKEGGR